MELVFGNNLLFVHAAKSSKPGNFRTNFICSQCWSLDLLMNYCKLDVQWFHGTDHTSWCSDSCAVLHRDWNKWRQKHTNYPILTAQSMFILPLLRTNLNWNHSQRGGLLEMFYCSYVRHTHIKVEEWYQRKSFFKTMCIEHVNKK